MKLLQKKIQGCQPNTDESHTESYQKDKICNDDEYSKPVQIYKGENDVYKLIWKIQKYVEKDIDVRDYCFIVIWPYITTKYRGSVHQDRNSNW